MPYSPRELSQTARIEIEQILEQQNVLPQKEGITPFKTYKMRDAGKMVFGMTNTGVGQQENYLAQKVVIGYRKKNSIDLVDQREK